jgi:hypothetical protein
LLPLSGSLPKAFFAGLDDLLSFLLTDFVARCLFFLRRQMFAVVANGWIRTANILEKWGQRGSMIKNQ